MAYENPYIYIFLTLYNWVILYMCQGLNPYYFHIIGDGHQPNSRGLYTHKITIPIKGGMTIPNIATGLTMAHMQHI